MPRPRTVLTAPPESCPTRDAGHIVDGELVTKTVVEINLGMRTAGLLQIVSGLTVFLWNGFAGERQGSVDDGDTPTLPNPVVRCSTDRTWPRYRADRLDRLKDVIGTPERWGRSARSLL